MLAHVAQAKRPRIPDQRAQHAPAAGQIADRRARWLIDADCQELRQRRAPFVEDAERRVARPGDLARGCEDPVENRLRIEFGYERTPRIQQATQVA